MRGGVVACGGWLVWFMAISRVRFFGTVQKGMLLIFPNFSARIKFWVQAMMFERGLGGGGKGKTWLKNLVYFCLVPQRDREIIQKTQVMWSLTFFSDLHFVGHVIA